MTTQSANLYEELASEYLRVARVTDAPPVKNFAEELAAEMVTLANLARGNGI